MVTKPRVKIRRQNSTIGETHSERGGGATDNEATETNPIGGDFDNPNPEGTEGVNYQSPEFAGNPEPETTLNTATRRGRPKGSKNKTAKASVFEEPLTPSKGVHSSGSKSKSKKKVMNEDEALQITQTLLTMLEGVSVSVLGEDARINDTEKMLMFASIPKMLSSVSESAVESVSKILYPATAIIALGAYSLRLASIYSEKAKGSEEDNFTRSQMVQTSPLTPVQNENMNGSDKPFSTNGEDKTIWEKDDLSGYRRGF